MAKGSTMGLVAILPDSWIVKDDPRIVWDSFRIGNDLYCHYGPEGHKYKYVFYERVDNRIADGWRWAGSVELPAEQPVDPAIFLKMATIFSGGTET